MITFAMFSYKGGTGKTKTVFNLAGVLAAEYNAKVLIIDADAQANITSYFLANEIMEKGGLHFLSNEVTSEDLFVTPEKINEGIRHVEFALKEGSKPKKRGIDIIPARSPKLKDLALLFPEINETMAADKDKRDCLKSIKPGCIRKAFTYLKHTKHHPYDYDFCIIDLHGEDDYPSREFLGAADYVIMPTTTDFGSISGITAINTNVFNRVREELNPDLKIAGIVASIVSYQSGHDLQALEMLKRDFASEYIDCPIRRSEDISWSTDSGIPLVYNRKTSPSTNDYRALAKALLEKVKGDKE